MNAPSGLAAHATLESLFHAQQQASRTDAHVAVSLRKDRLRRLHALLLEHAAAFETAISADFGHRSAHETRIAEALVVEAGVKLALRRVDRWAQPRRIRTELPFRPGSNLLMPQPLGVVGIVAPWNYPLQLTLSPATGALAAGNRIMLKPSEVVPQFTRALAAAVRQHFDPTEVAVVEGDADIAAAFVALPFDHLLFTGSARVGRLVAQAAAKNLTPITLELGGKSPAIIDPSADLAAAAGRIAFGKLLNAGQTCIAPDYVLCPRGTEERFAQLFFSEAAALYGTDPENPDYTAIVNGLHYERIERLVADATAKGARVEMGGARLADWKAVRKFPPCLVLTPSADMLLGQEEIFGPILPIFSYDKVEEAIAFVNARERPLALYWFGADTAARARVLRGTISGGVTVNDCLLHIVQENQPFGGVGASGTGAYHGEWGFRTFSKEKPVFCRRRVSGSMLLRPPYGRTFDAVFAALRRLL